MLYRKAKDLSKMGGTADYIRPIALLHPNIAMGRFFVFLAVFSYRSGGITVHL